MSPIHHACRRLTVPAHLLIVACYLFLSTIGSVSAGGDKLAQEDKDWLSQVDVLLLDSERQVYRDLKARDREELRRLFWARRNPKGPAADVNPFRDQYTQAYTEAATRFAEEDGAETDCGRLFLLLGEPDEIQPAPPETLQAVSPDVEMGTTTGDRPALGLAGLADAGPQPDVWRPVTQWVYASLDGVPSRELKVLFDDRCRASEGTRRAMANVIQPRSAEARVVNPWVEVRLDDKNGLVSLEEWLPKPGPTQALLDAPRQDFPVTQETMLLRAASGGTALLGTLEGHLDSTLAGKEIPVIVRAEARTGEGEISAFTERETTVVPAADGSFLVAFGLASRPGTYALRAGVMLVESERGSAVGQQVDVPDLSGDGLNHSTLAFLETIEQVSQPDKAGPLAPLVMGNHRLVPRVGRTFAKDETMGVFCHYYGAKTDPSTGRASVTGSLGVFKSRRLQFNRAVQTQEVVDGAFVYGPVPFDTFAPGAYEAEIKITDNVAEQSIVIRAPFEVTP